MNPFSHLPVPEYDEDDTITNDSEYEKKKKLLKKKKIQNMNNPLPERLKRIRSLKSAIQDYETKDVVHKNIYKKEPSVKSKDDETSVLLNRLSKQHRKLKNKQEVEDQQYNSKKRKQKNLLLNSNGHPKWSPNVHRLFPLYDRRCIKLLLLAKNNEDCIFSILPDEVVINNILSNVRWDWFYVKGNKRERIYLQAKDRQILDTHYEIKASGWTQIGRR